ncbi:MAG: hypothetical protein E7625_04585 [Ruminococcaceae bacterium]|nr:hypothetical protein [Oscillospiraceae bacterium]
MKTRRGAVCLFLLLMIGALLLLPVSGEQAKTDFPSLPAEYKEMLQRLPESLRESLPQRVFSVDGEEAAGAWEALVSPEVLFSLLLQPLKDGWRQYLSLLLSLVGVLLLRGVSNALIEHIRTPVLAGGVKLICRVALFGIILGQAIGGLSEIASFYEDLQALTAAFLPLMGTMYAMGGNVATAAANHTTLLLSMSLVQWIGEESVVPLFSLCLAFGLMGAISGEVAGRLQVVTGKLKKWYTTALGLAMLLLSTALGAQTTLTARADSLAFRTVRFAVSSTIPVVGGGVAEMLRTAATGISWLRGVVGIGGVVLLIWLLLPRLCSILLYRSLFSLAGDVASLLGCPEEGKLLGEVVSLYGYLLAVLSLSVMTFLLSLLLLLKCASVV